MRLVEVMTFIDRRRDLNTFFGLAEVFKFGKRLIGGVSTLFFRSINQLVEMTAIKNSDPILRAGVLTADVA